VEQRTIVLVGLNHRTAPVEVRERLAFGNGRLEPALRELIAVPGILEGAIVSTCNRVEVIACGADAAAVGSALPAFLAREHGVADPALATHLYTHADREAVRHLFRVAASLDSMVVGESQVLGQFRAQCGQSRRDLPPNLCRGVPVVDRAGRPQPRPDPGTEICRVQTASATQVIQLVNGVHTALLQLRAATRSLASIRAIVNQ